MNIQEALDRVWSDESLRRRLIADPKSTLQEFGMGIPDSKSVQIHENTLTVINVVLPQKPEGEIQSSSDPVAKTIERAWTDPEFKARLLADPRDTVAEMGVRIPVGTEVKVWENTPDVEHLVLPLNPSTGELSDADLEAVAGGSSSKYTQQFNCTPGLPSGPPQNPSGGFDGAFQYSSISGTPTLTPQGGKH